MEDSATQSGFIIERSLAVRTVLCGLLGSLVLSIATFIKFIIAIPRFFTEDWTWSEMLNLPLQVFGIGFVSGAIVGLLLPLTKSGRIGDVLIGVISGNAFMVACIFNFGDPKCLLNFDLSWLIAVSIASAIGGWLGFSCGGEFRKPQEEGEPSLSTKKAAPNGRL